MNILICDDMPETAEQLAGLLRDSPHRVNIQVFHNGFDALDYIHTGAAVDLCFLDIIMPEIDGIALAKRLRADRWAGKIVFLSTSKEYGPESYSVAAFDYLVKPPTAENLHRILDKAAKALQQSDAESILIIDGGVSRVIPHREISSIEVIGHYIHFQLTDGNKVKVRSTFTEVAGELLRDPRFVQCHRSFVVNMDEIKEISANSIVLGLGTKIPIARSYSETKNIFYQWKFGGGKDIQ